MNMTGRMEEGAKEIRSYIAIKNSKERLKSLAYDKIELMTRESNPATNVSELVGYLNSKRNE